jgi:hypothetical protein
LSASSRSRPNGLSPGSGSCAQAALANRLKLAWRGRPVCPHCCAMPGVAA